MGDVETRLRRTERILEIGRELTSTASLERLLSSINTRPFKTNAGDLAITA